MPPAPALPTWGSRADWRAWRHDQKRWEEERRRREKALRRAGRADGDELDATRPIEERLTAFRRKSIGTLASLGTLAVINIVTSPHVPWAIIPGAFMTLGILSRAGTLWADGVPLARLFSRGDAGLTGGAPALPAGTRGGDPALELASPEVLAGPHGEAVRRAAADRRAARELLGRLAPAEREMIPDVGPTLDSLAERVGALALTLHRLDADVGGASVPTLERRIAALRAESGGEPSAEQERRIALLDRQRASIAELIERRGALASQLESAVLAMQNLRLDLLKLRSSGLGSALSDVSSATQEARALSRDIGNAVDALREVRRL
jgi:serine/threonine-protein kinase